MYKGTVSACRSRCRTPHTCALLRSRSRHGLGCVSPTFFCRVDWPCLISTSAPLPVLFTQHAVAPFGDLPWFLCTEMAFGGIVGAPFCPTCLIVCTVHGQNYRLRACNNRHARSVRNKQELRYVFVSNNFSATLAGAVFQHHSRCSTIAACVVYTEKCDNTNVSPRTTRACVVDSHDSVTYQHTYTIMPRVSCRAVSDGITQVAGLPQVHPMNLRNL